MSTAINPQITSRIRGIASNARHALEWRLDAFRSRSVQHAAKLYRRVLPDVIFIGVTGSCGKSTTKELIAAVLAKKTNVHKTHGTDNQMRSIAEVLLRIPPFSKHCCVLEVTPAGFDGEVVDLDIPLRLIQPRIGVVTNIGSDHISAFGSQDAIAEAKGKLIAALPKDGIAVLNADDQRVLAMRERCAGSVITYGLGADATVRAENVSSRWPARLSFMVVHNGQSRKVQTQLCGEYWVHSALAAFAVGIALDMSLATIAKALEEVAPFEARLSPVELASGITFIRDDWKAPLWTIPAALQFMRDATASRKVIVIGTISDCGGGGSKHYAKVASSALETADLVVFVGPQSSAALKAKRTTSGTLLTFTSLRDVSAYLSTYLKSGDLVLLKGSVPGDHLQRLILSDTSNVRCWQAACGRAQFCDTCELLDVPSGPQTAKYFAANSPALNLSSPITTAVSSEQTNLTTFVIGLGNPDPGLLDTPHNVGYRAVDLLARRMGQEWHNESNLAMLARGELQGISVCLIKPLSQMNDVGTKLVELTQILGFDQRQCIVVHDDLDLPLGTVRCRSRGSDGGHRGVGSILQAFQDDRFRRVKIGVGHAAEGQSVLDFVLTPFGEEQRAIVATANSAAADKVIELLRQKVPA